MSNRGGARDGAGRPKGEETVMVRVPKGCVEMVRALISVYKNTGELPVFDAVQGVAQGDSHKQVQISFPDVSSTMHMDNSFQPKADAGPLHRRAIAAWYVYSDVVMAHPAGFELRDRYWQIAFDADELGYNYLFCLQLLERLVDMPKTSADWPLQWCNIRELRQFAKNLYKSNPQWH
ncbi:hypothetical protein [Aeromonas salmonicida]